MNNKLLWGVLAIIVIALLAWYFMRPAGSTSDNETTNNTTTQSESTSQTGSQTKSIEALMASNLPVTCTYTANEGGMEQTGRVSVSGGKMRGDFTVAGTDSHMINDGKYVYIWTDGIAQGVKMSASAMTTADTSTTNAPDLDKEQNFNCQPWTAATPSSFTPPTNVTFATL